MRNSDLWQAAGDSSKARSNSFHGQMQKNDGSGRAERDQDGARDFPWVFQAENHHRNREDGYRSWRDGEGIRRLPKGHHAVKEITGDVIHLQSKKVANLR